MQIAFLLASKHRLPASHLITVSKDFCCHINSKQDPVGSLQHRERWLSGRKYLVWVWSECHRALPHQGTYLSKIARQDESLSLSFALGNMMIRSKKLLLMCTGGGRRSHSSNPAEIISHANKLELILGRGQHTHDQAAFAIFSIYANGLVSCHPPQRTKPEGIRESENGLGGKGLSQAI